MIKFANTVVKLKYKILVWFAMGPKGWNRPPLLRKSGSAVNGQRHLNKSIRRRFIPYIRSNDKGGDYIFCPDMASRHYCKIVLSTSASKTSLLCREPG